MAKLYGEIAAKALLTLDKSFARANGQPLDASEVYYSKAAAEEYAATAQAYIGQKIVVIEDGVVTHYSVEDTAGTLKELGSKPVADGTTITIGEDGKITLANITDEEATGTYNAILVDGKLTWVKPSATTVEGLSDLIEALTSRVNTAEADIDALQSAVGVASKPESAEGAGDAVAATGLHKAIEDEIARAEAAEKALDERIDGIDFVDNAELATALEPYAKSADVVSNTTYATDKKALEDEDQAIREMAEGTKARVDTFLDTEGVADVVDSLKDIKAELDKLGDVVDLEEALALKADKTYVDEELGKKQDVIAENTYDAYGAAATAKSEAIADAEGKIATAKQEAINAAANDATTKANTAETNAKSYADTKLADKANVSDVYSKSQTYSQAEVNALIDQVTGGDTSETAASVKLQLDNYKKIVNAEVWGNEEATGDSRIDKLEAVGAQANVIEAVVAKTGAKLTATTEGKTVTIDDTALVGLINTAQAKAEEGVTNAATAQAKANSNTSEIEALKGRMTTAEGNISTNASSITALDVRVSANEGAITTIQGNVDKKADKTALDSLAETVGTNSGNITSLTSRVAANETAISNKADKTALNDYYTKSEIGELGDKTVITLINEAKAEATYNDTEVRGLITNNTNAINAIYKAGEGETPATGILADEIARATAAEAANKALIDKLTEDLGNVSNIMNFRGVVDKEAEGYNPDEPFASITDPAAGDVVILGEQEYVYNGTSWILFGDATGNAAAITALTARVEANETAIKTTLPGAIAQVLTDAKAYTDAEIAKINVGIINVASGHEALTVSVENGVATVGFAEELVLNGGSAN